MSNPYGSLKHYYTSSISFLATIGIRQLTCNFSPTFLKKRNLTSAISTALPLYNLLMAGNGPSGEALLVLENNDDKFSTNFRRMGQILQQPQYVDKEVVIMSIVGITRQGKSFFMNLLLMFLSGKVFDMSTMFDYKGGVEAVTKGIYMWSQPFIRKLPSGKEVVLLIMDSQGTFDNRTSEKGNVNIFGLSTIMSSVQIFNVMDNISEDYLKHLTLFSQFATMSFKASKVTSKTFQQLIFLVRDWIHDEDYGFKGGESLLNKVFKMDGRHADLQKVRATLLDTYENIDAFLVPDPGNVVKRGQFTGDVKEVSPAFLNQLEILFSDLVSERYLIPKRISGKAIKCSDVQNAFTTYFLALNENASPTNLVTATANIKFAIARSERERDFSAFIDNIISEENPRDELDLEDQLISYRNELCTSFPLGTDRCSVKVRDEQNTRLLNFMAERIQVVLKQNIEKLQKQEAESYNSKLSDEKHQIQQLLDNEKTREREQEDEIRRREAEFELQTVTMGYQIENAQTEAQRDQEILMMKIQMQSERHKENLEVMNEKIESQKETAEQVKERDLRQQEENKQRMRDLKKENEAKEKKQQEIQKKLVKECEERDQRKIKLNEKRLKQMEDESKQRRQNQDEAEEAHKKALAKMEEISRNMEEQLDEEQEKEKDRLHQKKVDSYNTKKEDSCTIS